jgi:4-hydroxy-tetrahydrodipicolinate reductase
VKVAVVGHGAMGHEVEAALRDAGHEPLIVGRGSAFPRGCPVGIDFTRADAVPDNVAAAIAQGARYVVGTTGWQERLPEVRRLVESAGGGLVYGANFSVGVQLYFRIVQQAATLLARFPDYDPYVLERHHRRKRDAPSGTARQLASILASSGGRRQRAAEALNGPLPDDAFHVAALRAGGIVGDHTVGFDAGGDEILLEHRARSRRGFAVGAVRAAEWIAARSGVHSFEDILDDLHPSS